AGTIRAQRMFMDEGLFTLSGGTLSTVESTLSSGLAGNSPEPRSVFTQSNGTHLAQNYLGVNGIYHLRGGTLNASNIDVAPYGDLWLEGGNLVNPGTFKMQLGGCFARGQYPNLGKLSVLLEIFPANPIRYTSILDLLNGSTVLRFADSRDAPWSGTLVITNWSGSLSGGGADQIFVG